MENFIASAEERFDEKFYEGERNSVNCHKHKIYATPSELKSFIRSEIQKAYQEGYEKGRETLTKEIKDYMNVLNVTSFSSTKTLEIINKISTHF